MREATPYHPPPEPGRWRALALAALVHLALLGLLWFGVHWQNQTPVAVEAEVWTPRPIEAAPAPRVEPQPVPQPEPPRPAPEPAPVPPEAVKPEPQPRAPDPDIVLEQEKKKRDQEEEKHRLEQEQRAEQAKKKAREEREERERKLAQQKLDKEKEAARKKEVEEQAKKEEQEKAKKLAEAKRKEEQARAKAEQERKRQDEAEAQASEARRQKDLERLRNQAGAGGAGEAPKASGSRADASYLSRVAAKIKSNTTFNVPDNLAGNPAVEYAVELLPDGSVRTVRKLKGSGVDGFDEAVRRAIERSQPYPPDKSGSVPSSFTVSHKPKDQ